MTRAFLLGMRTYLRLLAEALGPRGRRLAPLGPRRLAILLLGFPLFLAVQWLHWLGFALDEVFFRGYRRMPITAPLFVTGIPRSGTTFIHRSLARDRADFTTFRTWEALIAPSVTERRLIGGVARLDRWLGAPLHRLAGWITHRLAGRLAHIHEVGLDAPEEDYLALLPAAGCFILVLAFPASRDVWRLARFDEMPEKERRILLDFYTACLKKHLYVDGGRRRLLSKNAAFGAWVPDLAERFPDARFMICLRDPEAALRSQLSSLRGGMRGLGTAPAAAAFGREFAATFEHVHRQLHRAWRRLPAERLVVIDQARLKAGGSHVLERAFERLEIPITPPLKEVLADMHRETRSHTSRHRHEPPEEARLDPGTIARLSAVHTAMLADAPGAES
jgi:hypothetical protein